MAQRMNIADIKIGKRHRRDMDCRRRLLLRLALLDKLRMRLGEIVDRQLYLFPRHVEVWVRVVLPRSVLQRQFLHRRRSLYGAEYGITHALRQACEPSPPRR